MVPKAAARRQRRKRPRSSNRQPVGGDDVGSQERESTETGSPEKSRKPPEAPLPILVAGGVWCGVGGLSIIGAIVVFATMTGAINNVIAIGATVLPLFIGLVFIKVGVQTIRGTAPDTLGNGVGSLAIGGIGIGGAFYVYSGLAAYNCLVQSVVLFGAGILALKARPSYKAWYAAKNPAEIQLAEAEELAAEKANKESSSGFTDRADGEYTAGEEKPAGRGDEDKASDHRDSYETADDEVDAVPSVGAMPAAGPQVFTYRDAGSRKRGMKNAQRCMMCQSEEYWIVDPFKTKEGQVPVASQEGTGFLAADTFVGKFAAYICQDCGYTEMWAKDFDRLEEDAERGIRHSRSVEKKMRRKRKPITAKPDDKDKALTAEPDDKVKALTAEPDSKVNEETT